MTDAPLTTRRGALLGTAASLAIAHPALAALTRTPGMTAGPFYPPPEDRLGDEDADLLRIGAGDPAIGEPLALTGRILAPDGHPHGGAWVEIWQCDGHGRYLHSSDWSLSRSRDAAFQGYGQMTTGADGGFAFRTIKPVPYPGRTPHIHLRATLANGDGRLTTQLFIAGDPGNDVDGLYRRLTPAERAAADMTLIPDGSGWRAARDIVV